MKDCQDRCDANPYCSGLSATKSWGKCALLRGLTITHVANNIMVCSERNNFAEPVETTEPSPAPVMAPTMPPTEDFVGHDLHKCTDGKMKIADYTAVGATKSAKKAYCLAKCLEHPECETVHAHKTWKTCSTFGYSDVAPVANSFFHCYLRNMVDEWTFTEHPNTMCMGLKTARTKRSLKPLHKGIKESELRACKRACANDPNCNAAHYKGRGCLLVSGNIMQRTRSGFTCFTKEMSATSKSQMCWEASSKGLCDKAYTAQADCEADFGNSAMGTKFCKKMTDMMVAAGKKKNKGYALAMVNSSISRICGAECTGTGFTMHEGKFCNKRTIGSRVTMDNVSGCIAACAADENCVGFHRKHRMCWYQSRINANDLKTTKYTGNAWHKKDYCFKKD